MAHFQGVLSPLYTGVRVNTWGLRFYNKIIFGVCEVQTAYEKFDISSLKSETKLEKKAKFYISNRITICF